MKRLTTLLLVVTMLAFTAHAFAEGVYITKRGKKFHKEICRVTKNKQVQKIDLAGALEKKLTACKRCFSPEEAEALLENHSTADKQVKSLK